MNRGPRVSKFCGESQRCFFIFPRVRIRQRCNRPLILRSVCVGVTAQKLCFWVLFAKPVAGAFPERKKELRKRQRSVQTRLRAAVEVALFRSGRDTFETEPPVNIEAFQASEDVPFFEAHVVVRTRESLGDGHPRLVGPGITVERT